MTSGSQEAVFTGDLFHIVHQFARPNWHIVVEHDVPQGAATRKAFVDRYTGTGVRWSRPTSPCRGAATWRRPAHPGFLTSDSGPGIPFAR